MRVNRQTTPRNAARGAPARRRLILAGGGLVLAGAAFLVSVPAPKRSELPVERGTLVSVAEPAPRPDEDPPASPRAVYARSATSDEPARLAFWVGDADLEPPVRYAALRRLAELDPGKAVVVALQRLGDPEPMVRLNALALLARSPDARARRAIAELDPEVRRQAERLASATGARR